MHTSRTRIALTLWICLVVSSGCAELKRLGYEGFNRDRWQQPDRVIASLDLDPGDRVADLGAGGGYFSFRLAEAVGPNGVLYAVDVDSDMTDLLTGRVADGGYDNVEVILAEFHDPLLPDGQIDLLFTSNTYHHIQDRVVYFTNLRRDLKPDGRVAVIELNGSSWFARSFGHETALETIVEEMVEAGYRLDRSFDFLERQHFAIFSVGKSREGVDRGLRLDGPTPP